MSVLALLFCAGVGCDEQDAPERQRLPLFDDLADGQYQSLLANCRCASSVLQQAQTQTECADERLGSRDLQFEACLQTIVDDDVMYAQALACEADEDRRIAACLSATDCDDRDAQLNCYPAKSDDDCYDVHPPLGRSQSAAVDCLQALSDRAADANADPDAGTP